MYESSEAMLCVPKSHELVHSSCTVIRKFSRGFSKKTSCEMAKTLCPLLM